MAKPCIILSGLYTFPIAPLRIFALVKRPLIHRLFSGFLALLVLTASVGLTVLRHTCRQSGHTSTAVIFQAPHHRCANTGPVEVPAAGAHVKSACCDFDAHFHKLDTSSPALAWLKSLVPDLAASWLPTTAWPTLPLAAQHTPAMRWYAADSSPPARAGRALLTFVCTLVI